MVIGIDLGGMSAKAALLANGVLCGKSSVKTSSENTPQETAAALVKLCMTATEKAGKKFENVDAIGIGSPGAIDSQTGSVVSWTNFGWSDVPLAELVQKFSGKRTFVVNDANAAALGEAKFGAGKKYRDSVLVTLGTGVGGGILIDGKLFEGYKCAGAEIGHMVIRQDGELCTCGRKGCFERYASASALIRRTKAEMSTNRDSAMWKIAETLNGVDGKTAFLAARQGDKAAQRVVDDYVAALGEGIANIVNIVRPEAIILGGGVSAEGENLLKPLRTYLYPRIFARDYAPLDVICAKLGNDAGLYGAAEFANERL